MKVSVIQRLFTSGWEQIVRKDVLLPVRPFVGVTLVFTSGNKSLERQIKPGFAVALVEGQDRIIAYMDDVEVDEGQTSASLVKRYLDLGFVPTEEIDPDKMTPWSVVGGKPNRPVRPSPCCGYESSQVATIGTAIIYACNLCGTRFHYAGGAVVPGMPMQDEPGVRLPDAFATLDPTTPSKQLPCPIPVRGDEMAEKLDPNAGHGAGDGFPGSDYDDVP